MNIKELFNKYKHNYLLDGHRQTTPLMDFNNFKIAIAEIISSPVEPGVMPKIAEEIKPQFHYDEEADVMYISFGKPKSSGCEDYKELVIRRAENKLTGITIIHYSKKVSNFSA